MGLKIENLQKDILAAVSRGENIDEVLAKFNSEMAMDFEDEYKFTKLKLKFQNSSNNPDPEYAKASDSGFDLRAFIDKPITLKPLERAIVPTGLFFEIPDGYEIQVRPRSGLAAKNGITVLNTPGTVDCFSEDMLITTIDGAKKIEDINVNEIIISYNVNEGVLEKDVISKIIDAGKQEVIKVTTDEGVLEITDYSEILTNNNVWKYGKDLKVDDFILTKSLNLSKIKKIERIGEKQTYDLTVTNNANFLCNNHIIHNSGYRGEVKIILVNLSNETFTFKSGERIAQAVFVNVANKTLTELIKIDKVSTETERGAGGLGSTGLL